jgi:hypothetical protein
MLVPRSSFTIIEERSRRFCVFFYIILVYSCDWFIIICLTLHYIFAVVRLSTSLICQSESISDFRRFEKGQRCEENSALLPPINHHCPSPRFNSISTRLLCYVSLHQSLPAPFPELHTPTYWKKSKRNATTPSRASSSQGFQRSKGRSR